MASPPRHRPLGYGIAAAVFAVDQLVKWIVIGPLDLRNRLKIELLPFFDLTWVENYGVSMGFLTQGSPFGQWLLVGLTGTIAMLVALWIWREARRADVVALGLVFGGALGNILDRVRYGYVADFADLHIGAIRPFLIFNVADAAITIGVLLLVVRALLTREKPKSSEDVHA